MFSCERVVLVMLQPRLPLALVATHEQPPLTTGKNSGWRKLVASRLVTCYLVVSQPTPLLLLLVRMPLAHPRQGKPWDSFRRTRACLVVPICTSRTLVIPSRFYFSLLPCSPPPPS